MPLIVKTDRTDQLFKGFAALVKKEVLVGVPDSNAGRSPEPGEKTVPTNAMVAAVMEMGSPLKNIPARPFLVPGVQAAAPQIVAQLKKAAVAAINFDTPQNAVAAVDRALNAAGLIAQGSVQQKITDGPFEKLSTKTLAARKRRGFDGEKPLLETGQLRRSISYVVRERTKGRK